MTFRATVASERHRRVGKQYKYKPGHCRMPILKGDFHAYRIQG